MRVMVIEERRVMKGEGDERGRGVMVGNGGVDDEG